MTHLCRRDAAPLPGRTVRRETPDGGRAAVTLYPVFPGIDIRYHDVHAGSCPMDPAAPGALEISHCREGRMEYRLGDRYFYLAPGDLSVARQDVLPTAATFPTGHYHGVTVTVDPRRAPRCLSCFLEDVEVQPAAPAELSFEDKLKQFMSVSDSKQSELNRYMASKRGGRRRK